MMMKTYAAMIYETIDLSLICSLKGKSNLQSKGEVSQKHQHNHYLYIK